MVCGWRSGIKPEPGLRFFRIRIHVNEITAQTDPCEPRMEQGPQKRKPLPGGFALKIRSPAPEVRTCGFASDVAVVRFTPATRIHVQGSVVLTGHLQTIHQCVLNRVESTATQARKFCTRKILCEVSHRSTRCMQKKEKSRASKRRLFRVGKAFPDAHWGGVALFFYSDRKP